MGIKHALWFVIAAQAALIGSGAWSVNEAVWGAAEGQVGPGAPAADVTCDFNSSSGIELCPRRINAQNDGAKTYTITASVTPLSLDGDRGGARQTRDAGFVWVHNLCGTKMHAEGRCIDDMSVSPLGVGYVDLPYAMRRIKNSTKPQTHCEMHVEAIRSLLVSRWYDLSARCGV